MGNVKIGCSDQVEERLRAIHSEELVLLATEGGGVVREQELHLRFAVCHIAHEWFKPVPRLRCSPVSLRELAIVREKRPKRSYRRKGVRCSVCPLCKRRREDIKWRDDLAVWLCDECYESGEVL